MSIGVDAVKKLEEYRQSKVVTEAVTPSDARVN